MEIKSTRRISRGVAILELRGTVSPSLSRGRRERTSKREARRKMISRLGGGVIQLCGRAIGAGSVLARGSPSGGKALSQRARAFLILSLSRSLRLRPRPTASARVLSPASSSFSSAPAARPRAKSVQIRDGIEISSRGYLHRAVFRPRRFRNCPQCARRGVYSQVREVFLRENSPPTCARRESRARRARRSGGYGETRGYNREIVGLPLYSRRSLF